MQEKSTLSLIYLTCKDVVEAKKIGKTLLEKRLCACINIFPSIESMFFWPKENPKLKEEKEAVLLIKTLSPKYKTIESEVSKLHSYDLFCRFAIPIQEVNKDYLNWLKRVIKGGQSF